MVSKEIELIRKIHARADDSCYAAILKAWDIDDPLYSEENLKKKQEIIHLLRGQEHLSEDEIANKMHLSLYTVKKHIKQYDHFWNRYWNPESIDESMYDRLYPTSSFLKKCEELSLSGAEDTYFSLNSFWRRNKAGIDVRHINAFVLDFDFYKLPQYSNMSPAEFYQRKIQRLLPMLPTGIVDSGRGLYVLYAFDHCSYHMQKLYKAVQLWFYQKFKSYGMDRSALNLTQVIRVPGTLNTKSLNEVTVLEFNDTAYKIHDFARLLPYTQQEVKKYKVAKLKGNKVKKSDHSACKMKRKPYFEEFLDDMKKLIVLRNRSQVYEGYRETLLYLVRERAVWSGYSINESVQLALECNQMMHWPLSQQEVEKQCRPSSGRQKTSIDTIIDKLSINATEQLELKILRRKWLKKSMYSKKKQKHPLMNITKKQLQILQRRTAVCELKNKKHLKNADIAAILDVDKSTVTRDLKYIKDHPSEFVVVLKKYMDELEEHRHGRIFCRHTTYDQQKQLLEWLKRGYTALDFLVREIGVAKN